MRRFALALLLIGCKKDTAPATPPPEAKPAAPAPADAGQAGPEDLLHLVPMRVAMSSVVANGAYSPFDLVDGDLTTAWNARTGEAKPWIAFRVPPSTHVVRARITVGFTGKGPEGDYFTMNPRIKKVRVWQDKVSLREVALNPESRELQDVPIDANGGDYRIEVIETVPGSRKDWREVCVSELQVIGLPPPGMKPRDDLEVLVGSLDGKPLEDPRLQLAALSIYDSLDAFCKQFVAHNPGKPECGVDVLGSSVPALPKTWPKSWKSARWIGTKTAPTSVAMCDLEVDVGGKIGVLEGFDDSCGVGYGANAGPGVRFEASMHGDWFVLLTARMERNGYSETRRSVTEELRVCATDREGAPACTDPLAVGQLTHVEEASGGPGNDGLDVHDDVAWQFRYKIAGNVLMIEKDSGKPDPDAARLLGRHGLER